MPGVGFGQLPKNHAFACGYEYWSELGWLTKWVTLACQAGWLVYLAGITSALNRW